MILHPPSPSAPPPHTLLAPPCNDPTLNSTYGCLPSFISSSARSISAPPNEGTLKMPLQIFKGWVILSAARWSGKILLLNSSRRPGIQSLLFPHPRCIKKESSLSRSSSNNHLGQRMCDSLCWLAATMDFLSSDIAVTLLAKVLEVNDSGQCQRPLQIKQGLYWFKHRTKNDRWV